VTPAPLAGALEVALNRYLRIEPDAEAAISKLNGKRIAVVLTPINWQLLFEVLPSGVRVAADETEPAPHVTLTGSPVTLMARAAEMARGAAFSAQGLQVSGEAETLRQFAAAVDLVGADVEEWLAPWLGDVIAHRAAGALRSLFAFGQRAFSELGSNAAEYLQEETYDLARRVDVDEWMESVELLRDGVDRFEARLQRVERGLR
jgi:ubiquinone biosynthesis accessory factor UbiJ